MATREAEFETIVVIEEENPVKDGSVGADPEKVCTCV